MAKLPAPQSRPADLLNPNLRRLLPYPFETLARLRASVTPNADLPPLKMTVGEPGLAPPEAVLEVLHSHLHEFAAYPPSRGLPELRQAAAAWLGRRFAAELDPDTQVLPLGGTREGLFCCAQALIDPTRPNPTVVVPNPFYKIYEGAAFMAGARPYPLSTGVEADDFLEALAAVPEAVWGDCQLLYLCSPNNPTGSVLPPAALERVLHLAERFDFVVAADECYSEIYPPDGTPPCGLLQASARLGDAACDRALVFHSLSKRSSLAGLRSGFVAGGAGLIDAMARYRTYHGVTLPVPVQRASIAAWSDEVHVERTRRAYQERFDAALAELDCRRPCGGFYLWLDVGGDDCGFAVDLYEQ
ncbi:MAG: aminotransferase class I/II-fold pyridoxal phosphate-dependent enzyme, partial [Gammaproteobacteria bacterium AqS3]|nr:aminotransferase class I/II-fold pyridoxal phosphate-dependent enzyme [Gammaproteobacteria bacterium AqS3]